MIVTATANTPSEKASMRWLLGFSSARSLGRSVGPLGWTCGDLVMALPIRHREARDLALSRKQIVVRINQVDRHFMRSRRQPINVDGIAVARVRPQPWQVVDRDVQVSHAWRDFERPLAEHR